MADQEPARLFELLESRMAADEPPDAMHFGRDRWPVVTVIVGFGLTLAAKYLGDWAGWVTLFGIVLEYCALGVLAWRQAKDVVPEFFDAKRKFAKELDKDFVDAEQLRAWLRQFPEDVRRQRLRFAEDRLSNFERRFPLVFGAVDKLGFLPVLVALFLQMRWLPEISIWEGLLGIGILALYFMALWMFRLRVQLERYVRLLRSIE